MTHKQKMQAFLDGQNISIPVEEFVSITSNIYHSHEAQQYDERHISIDKSREHWQNVTQSLSSELRDLKRIRVLDFGCGIGFAANELVTSQLNPEISTIVCYDLSPDMIKMCENRFASDSRFEFYADHDGLDHLLNQKVNFDIIVCNSLLHHILEPAEFFKIIARLLSPNGTFVMGHEPNKLFYNNRTLQITSKGFRLYKKVKNRISPRGKLNSKNITRLTYDDLLKKSIIDKKFPQSIIPKFVDIHVPMSNYKEQPWGEMGFDVQFLNSNCDSSFSVVKQISYNHIKDQEVYKSKFWTYISRILKRWYPFDGADSITVYRKIN